MSDEMDPEVLADLRLRAATERDPSRSREMPSWSPPKVHSQVPCRGRCGAVVDWNEDAEERFQIFNRELERRNEAPLDRTKIVFCNACRAEGAKAAADRNRKLNDAVGAAIRELKMGCQSHREHELLDKLEKAGHPDIAGLRQWLKDQAAKGKRGNKGDL